MGTMPQYHLRKKVNVENLLSVLPSVVKCISAAYIKEQRWFGSKSRDIMELELCDAAVFSHPSRWYALTLIRVTYTTNEAEIYVFPLSFIRTDTVVSMDEPVATLLEVESIDGNYAVFDALEDDEFCMLQLDYIRSSMTVKALDGRFNFLSTPVFDEITDGKLNSRISLAHLKAEQSNTSIIYGEAFIMKNFRKLSYGINPDLEIPLFLTTQTNFGNIARVAGYIEYTGSNNLKTSIASLQTFIPNDGDGWSYTLEHLKKFYEFALQHSSATSLNQSGVDESIGPIVREFSNHYLNDMYRLGQVTGELHVALASDAAEPDFAPEEITMADVTLWTSRMRSYGTEIINSLQNAGKSFSSQIAEQLSKVSDNVDFYLRKSGELAILAEQKIWKTRYHNDYHLGQVLKTGNDFVVIDFEGEPARPLEERRQKQSPLKDVAGMLRSFNYAVYAAIFNMKLESERMEMWGRVWEELVKKSYLNGYLVATGGTDASFLPDSEEAMLKVLSVFQMDKAIYELNYELNNRPTWVEIPLKYLISLLY